MFPLSHNLFAVVTSRSLMMDHSNTYNNEKYEIFQELSKCDTETWSEQFALRKMAPVDLLNAFSVAQLCPTIWDPMDCNPSASSVHGIFQARILEWVAISYSRGSSWPRDWTWVSSVSCIGRWILYDWATWEALAQWRVVTNLQSAKKHSVCRISLVVQLLRLHTSIAGPMVSIPGWGTKILHAEPPKKKKEKTNNNLSP